jgi:hypothetical protein
MITPHPETDDMTRDEMRDLLAETEEQLAMAHELKDDELVVWLTQRIRIFEAALQRRNGEGEEGKKRRETQADIIIKMVKATGAELFHTPMAEPYISFPVNDHWETWAINSTATKQWLRRCYFLTTNKAPNNDALQTTIGQFESHARFDGKTLDVNLRTAWDEGALYFDLCDSKWRAIKIDADGWGIIDKPAVKFIRFSHMAAQVEPATGGNIDELFEFINVVSVHERELVKYWLAVGLIPDIPRPCLALHGDQGSGKTSTASKLRALIDPSAILTLRCKDDAEIVQGLAHHYCPVLDNLSNIPEWLSDTLSRAVTGEGFTKRALYTNSDDILFAYKRVLILTGIDLLINKPDLLDRSIIVGLERIPDNQRRDEQLLNQRFEAARPRLFGAVLDMLVGALREYANVKPQPLPRMADFAKWAIAVSLGQGREPAGFVRDFASNVDRQNDEALNASVIATVLLAFLADGETWEGQAHELYAKLKEKADAMKIPAKSFPGSAAAMGRRLREIRPNLASLGWRIDFEQSARARKIIINRYNRENAVITVSTVSTVSKFNDGNDGNDGKNGILTLNTVPTVDPWEKVA